ncbi:MAG: 1-deoxy-D-xylulose-5-phosphate reductoisomerase [Planctomycetes bacterium]|nr:1-deoxy-D-xylulose-5-phosphate reductoisomerase [Planctomycetota bacterium]
MAERKKNIVVLGSTGSVGVQTLDVVRKMPDRFRIVGLSAHSQWSALAKQAEEFRPELLALSSAEAVRSMSEAAVKPSAELATGSQGLRRLATYEGADIIVAAISGVAGIEPVLAAVEAGKTLALANKESVVACGRFLMDRAHENGARILPVDSEHSALFQLLHGVDRENVRAVILTASGGPFLKMSLAERAGATPLEALKHPTWKMGPKLSVDSATMMNKVLEVIEARWLFDLPPECIRVLIHPQSIIHALVELEDGSLLAHLGAPDMRLPIQYALTHPERVAGAPDRLNLDQMSDLQLHEPDVEQFPALPLARRVLEAGGTAGAALISADEAAVSAFLQGRISFYQIVPLVEKVLGRHAPEPLQSIQQIRATIDWARKEAESCLSTL